MGSLPLLLPVLLVANTLQDTVMAQGSRCLLAEARDPDAKEWEVCIALGDKRRQWLRGNLVPKVLMVRNAVQPVKPNQALCEKVARREEPASGEVRPPSSGHCTEISENAYVPEMPVCKESSRAFIEFTGPLFAIKNVSGIGAHGKLSEARQANAVRALRASMGEIPRKSREPAVTVIDLLPKGVRYPLGWHLSPAAQASIKEQGKQCALNAGPLAQAAEPGR